MRSLGLFSGLAGLVFALVSFTSPVTAGAAEEPGTYIVRLADAPLARYHGGVAGLAPTSPLARGTTKLDVDSPASRAYLSWLEGRQDAVLTAASATLARDVAPAFRYRYAVNGFAATMTPTEAARIQRLPGVVDVRPEATRRLLTDVGPAWIGAPAIWDGTATRGLPGTKGEGVVVGVIDTGINHDHPSFADVGGDGYDHTKPEGSSYKGLCDPTTGLPFCNDKLIGVYDFTGTTPNDDHSHGSHTASTAAGNVLPAAEVVAPTTTVTREISGVAPHANIISYKGCVTAPADAAGACTTGILTAAIDQAVADEVDVVNYSIGGGPVDPWDDTDSLAFLGAREAGVFVSVSAGNDGPGAETVGSPANAPWVTSVGASTHNRSILNSLKSLSGGDTTAPGELQGAGFTSGYGPAPIVHAEDYGDELCGAPFAPGTFDGEIVVCVRGVNPRVEKGRNVEIGGAGGMVLVNSPAEGESTVGDAHELPAVHLGYTSGKKLTDWLASGTGHTGTISGTVFDTSDANGDIMAGFSSRGPNKPVPGVIKPDVTAPGVDILAAYKTTNPASGPEFGLMSGTSMSSPHVAGAAALVRAVHPAWTPAEVQSALTTTGVTAGVRKDDGSTAADAFDMGGGRVDLTRAAAAGLVLDVDAEAFDAADPAADAPGDPTTLNLATLGNADCVASCTWARTFENATSATRSWRVASGDSGPLSLSVKPSRFRLAPGDSVTVTVTADVQEATEAGWLFGSVGLQSKGLPTQTLPVAVLAGGTAQQVDVAAAQSSGATTVEVTTPVDVKDLTTTVFGLQQAVSEAFRVEQDPTMLEPYDEEVGTRTVMVDVPAGAQVLTADIADTTAADLDLFVGRDANGDGEAQEGEEVCRSASETAMESCSVRKLTAGTYWVLVQNWLNGQVIDDVELDVAVIPGTDKGNLTVSGPDAPAGSTFDVDLSWNEPGLQPGTRWVALVQLGSSQDHPLDVGSLLVRVTRP